MNTNVVIETLRDKVKLIIGKEHVDNGYWFSTHIQNEPHIIYFKERPTELLTTIADETGEDKFCKGEGLIKDLSIEIFNSLRNNDFKDILIEFDDKGNYAGICIINEVNNEKGFHINYLCSIKSGTGSKILNKIKKFIIHDNQNNKKYPISITLTPLTEAIMFYLSQKFQPDPIMRWNIFLEKRPSALQYLKTSNENTAQLEKYESLSDPLFGGHKNGLTRRRKRRHHGTQKRITSNIIKRSKQFV